uniref:Uncharacterized protein n=1 Tax=Parascaris univalens TaxID=6257 RepID=A0A915AMM9_PARUN
MLSAYMGDMKGDANGFYFPYAASMAPNMVPQNFPAYGVPLSTYESNKDENYPTTAQQQPQQLHSHKASPMPEDEESKKKIYFFIKCSIRQQLRRKLL